jgi:hypothetical protein
MLRETPSLNNGVKRSSSKGCWSTWCCPGRCAWFTSLFAGVVVTFAILAFTFAMISWFMASFASSQTVYTQSGPINTSPQNAVLAGSPVPLQMTMPNNLLEYAGASYTVDCLTPGAHTITLAAGPLPTTWDGVHRVATCGGPLTGFSFRVITSSVIRVTVNNATNGVTFS